MMLLNTKAVPCAHHQFNRPIGHCWWCEFSEMVGDMSEKFHERFKEYNDSYKTCPIKFLITRLEEEMAELQGDLSYDELIDVANQALMLAWRLKQRADQEHKEGRKPVQLPKEGKECVGCGVTHDDYSGTQYDFPTGIMVSLTCNLCNADNGLWALPDNERATRIA